MRCHYRERRGAKTYVVMAIFVVYFAIDVERWWGISGGFAAYLGSYGIVHLEEVHEQTPRLSRFWGLKKMRRTEPGRPMYMMHQVFFVSWAT